MRRSTAIGLTVAAAAIVVTAVSSCLHVGEDRAERDLTVGKATIAEARIVVTDGLAVVRSAEAGRLVLWASAPAFDLRIDTEATAPAEWSIELRNAMPDAELTTASGGASIVRQSSELATRPRWNVQLTPGTSTVLRLAPPDEHDRSVWSFALLSDVQEAVDDVQDIFSKVNRQESVRFLLGAGDLTQQGSAEQLKRYQRELRKLDVPYYTTLGNHELGSSPPPWHDYFGRSSFRFVYRDVQFSMLDSGSATLDPLVYGWLDGWLDEGRDRVHIVAMHIPPIDPVGVRNGSFASRNEAAKLLGRLANGRVDLTLYGHIHSHYEFDNGGIPAHISGGGGAIPERLDGIGRHFMIVDVGADRGIEDVRVVRVD